MMAFQPNSALLLDVAFLCACSAYNVPAAPRNANGMHNATRLTRVQVHQRLRLHALWHVHARPVRVRQALVGRPLRTAAAQASATARPLRAQACPKPFHVGRRAVPRCRRDGPQLHVLHMAGRVAGRQRTRAQCRIPTPCPGSLGLACSQDVTGPYTVVEPVAFPFRPGHFDAAYLENVVLTYSPHDHGYLMAYTTSPPNVARNTLNWEGNGGNVSGLQYMGLAFTKDLLNGPWARLNRTILAPREGGF